MQVSFALTLALAGRPAGEVTVRAVQGKIDITARNAVLADVLDRVARQTGMVISYEGPPPRQLISLSLRGRAPADVVVQILEGQGLNYALVMDASATKVAKLLVTTAPAPSRAASSQAPTHSASAPVHVQAPEEPVEEPPVEIEDPAAIPVEAPPPADGLPPGVLPPGPNTAPPGAGLPNRPGPPPGTLPFTPPTSYSNSPFDPKPVTFGGPTPGPAPTPPPQP